MIILCTLTNVATTHPTPEKNPAVATAGFLNHFWRPVQIVPGCFVIN